MHFKDLNEQIRTAKSDTVTVESCIGQRYIGDGLSGKTITINGTPGNALGAYLNGAQIYVNGNAQDATGDTMNAGRIVINGSSGRRNRLRDARRKNFCKGRRRLPRRYPYESL